MTKRLLIGLILGLVVVSTAWAVEQQIQVGLVEIKESLKYMDWKINFMVALIVAILGFVFYLAREIGSGTREKLDKIAGLEASYHRLKEYLEQISEKFNLPKPIL